MKTSLINSGSILLLGTLQRENNRQNATTRCDYLKKSSDTVQYRNNLSTSIEYYQKALKETYDESSPYTDALIYSNLGLAYTWLQQYHKAYLCYEKATLLGVNKEMELRYLKNKLGFEDLNEY